VRIAIIGAGRLGTAIAKRLKQAGHSIVLSFSTDSVRLQELGEKLGVETAEVSAAVASADVVALAFNWGAVDAAVQAMGQISSDKIVWDCTNPIKSDFSGLAIGTETSGGEIIAKKLSARHFVKAIPPFAELLDSDDPMLGEQASGVFVCGDDADANAVIIDLMRSLPSNPIDAGPLTNARYIEPAMMLLVSLAYRDGRGTRIGLSLIADHSGG
jgi:8-hydroxy-5-deazaflavin:NADPH oxidoreductase